MTHSQHQRAVLKVQSLQSIRHDVAVLNQILHGNQLVAVGITSRKKAIRVWQVVVGEVLKYWYQVAVGCDLVGEGIVAAKHLAPSFVYDLPLDDQTG